MSYSTSLGGGLGGRGGWVVAFKAELFPPGEGDVEGGVNGGDYGRGSGGEQFPLLKTLTCIRRAHLAALTADDLCRSFITTVLVAAHPRRTLRVIICPGAPLPRRQLCLTYRRRCNSIYHALFAHADANWGLVKVTSPTTLQTAWTANFTLSWVLVELPPALPEETQ